MLETVHTSSGCHGVAVVSLSAVIASQKGALSFLGMGTSGEVAGAAHQPHLRRISLFGTGLTARAMAICQLTLPPIACLCQSADSEA